MQRDAKLESFSSRSFLCIVNKRYYTTMIDNIRILSIPRRNDTEVSPRETK